MIGKSSTAGYANESGDNRAIGKELGARYVLDGTIRLAGSTCRISVQLVNAANGATLWAENFTRIFSADSIFDLQDDLVPTIVATVAETNGVLTHNMWTSLRDRDPSTLTPYEAMLRCFGGLETLSSEELTLAATALERVTRQEPNHSGCMAMLSVVYSLSYGIGVEFSKHPQPLEAGLACARRAVTLEPSNHLAHLALAMAHHFRKETAAFQSAMERACTLNPMDGYTLGSLGLRTAFLGDWEKGCEMVRKAMKLNPRHPGWYFLVPAANAYRQRDFISALEFAVKVNAPTNVPSVALLLAIHGQLRNQREAKQTLQELLALRPDFARTSRQTFERYFTEPDVIDLWVEGWRKAGVYDDEPQ